MNAFYWYLAGFVTCAVLALGWHYGFIQPRLKALAALAEDRLKAGVETIKGKL